MKVHVSHQRLRETPAHFIFSVDLVFFFFFFFGGGGGGGGEEGVGMSAGILGGGKGRIYKHICLNIVGGEHIWPVLLFKFNASSIDTLTEY